MKKPLLERRRQVGLALALAGLGALGCSDNGDPTGSGGVGAVSFTTFGEAYIEHEIPADPAGQAGFIDGWTVKYDHFLVNFANIAVKDEAGATAASMPGMKLFDNHVPDVKSNIELDDVPAKAYALVSYEITPPTTDGDVGARWMVACFSSRVR